MEDDEYKRYLPILDLYLAKQRLDEKLERNDEHYANLQNIEWNVHSEMYDIEQQQENLLEKQQMLEAHIRLIER